MPSNLKTSATHKRFYQLGLILGLLVVITSGCGGRSMSSQTSQPPVNAPTGSLTIFGGDAPLCDVISFTVTISSATLTPEGGGSAVTVISSANPVTVDFAALMEFFTVLNFATVPAATYTQATLTLSNPQLMVLDMTQSPPATVAIATTLTASTVTVEIDPQLKVTASGSAGLELDFKLRKSVQTGANGQVTGTVNPVFKVSSRTASSEEGLGNDDDLEGLVQSVTTTSSDPSFVGSFVLQKDSGQTFTIQVTSKSEFDDISGLSALTTMTFVEVEGFVDANGNIVAKKVEAEENEEQQKAAFVGMITSVVRNSDGTVSQFNLFVREVEPQEGACVREKSNLTVNLSSDTQFNIAAEDVNEAGLTLDSTALTAGQIVVAHGHCEAGTAPGLNATSIFLKRQTILGNFSTLLPASSDGKSGGFTLTPCGAAFLGQPITVLTFGDTEFEDVAGLSALTPSPMLAVKGLLFYRQQPLTVNGISVTIPALVFEAKTVHQLQ